MPQPDSDWYCAWCGEHYPVPTLARLCEAKHEATERGEQ